MLEPPSARQLEPAVYSGLADVSTFGKLFGVGLEERLQSSPEVRIVAAVQGDQSEAVVGTCGFCEKVLFLPVSATSE